jgi:hypothetical protein
MLLDAAILAIIVGFAFGGRLHRLKDLHLRAPWAFITAAVIQIGLLLAGLRGWSWIAGIGQGLLLFTYLLILVGMWLNRRLPGVVLAGAGVLMNALVIGANGGSMPVDRELTVRAGNQAMVALLDSPAYTKHTAIGPGTKLKFLGDILPLPMLAPRPKWFSPGSIGDIFITFGACWLLLAGMGARLRKREPASPAGEIS